MLWLVAFSVLTGLAALQESLMLAATGDPMPLNALRISNQIYSVAVVLVLLKLRKPVWPRDVNVRATTFGIYLTHPLIILALVCLFNRTVLNRIADLPGSVQTMAVFFVSLGFFTATYGCSLALTRKLHRNPRLRWMVGNFA
jgi:surface polysaccharide O-acyltransferase-like enzyme